MGDVTIRVPTGKGSMEEVRPELDAALAEAFPGGLLRRRWEGDTLHLTGPGATGTIILESGELIGHAELGPPASIMQDVIEEKVGGALRRAAA